MNKKAMSPIMTIVIVIILLLLWSFALGDMIAYWGHAASIQETGLVALFLDQANFFFFFIPLLIFIIVSPSIGGDGL